jgi:hypothetical protein
MNKTMASPGGFGSILTSSPSRPKTGVTNEFMSPKKKSSYHLSNLDSENETVQRLKVKLDHFVKYKDNPHQTEDILFGCLSDMLGKVSLTTDKNLQERQLKEVDKWFDSRFSAVEHRVKVPSYLSNTTRASTNQNTPRNNMSAKSSTQRSSVFKSGALTQPGSPDAKA